MTIKTTNEETTVFTFKPNCKLFLHSGCLPRRDKSDKAFFNRIRIVPFDSRVMESDQVDESVHSVLKKIQEVAE